MLTCEMNDCGNMTAHNHASVVSMALNMQISCSSIQGKYGNNNGTNKRVPLDFNICVVSYS